MNSCVAAREAVAPANPPGEPSIHWGWGFWFDNGGVPARQFADADGREPGRQ
jgi:hypothetical protein